MDSLPALPLEIVIYILKLLSFSDRKQARLVCQHWYYASQDPHFLLHEIVEIKHNKQIYALLNSTRSFHHFVFKGIDINWRIGEFWNRFGPSLSSVSLLYCDIHERDFIDMLKYCPSLESLQISGCRELLMSGRLLSDDSDVNHLKSVLLNLKELSIQDNSYLSDELFNRFIAICPNLESLSFNNCQISFHQGLCKKFYPNLKDADCFLASSSILTFHNIFNFVCRNPAKIRHLSFSRTILDSQALSQLAQVSNAGLQVASLQVSHCEQLTDAGVLALSQSQYSLQHLDLSYCSRLTDATLISICQNLKHLRHLDLRKCGAFTNTGISRIRNLQNLIYLDLSYCYQLGNEGIEEGIFYAGKLRQLHLSGLSNVTMGVICRLASALPHLTHFDLSYCHTAVTDTAIQAIFEHQVTGRNYDLYQWRR